MLPNTSLKVLGCAWIDAEFEKIATRSAKVGGGVKRVKETKGRREDRILNGHHHESVGEGRTGGGRELDRRIYEGWGMLIARGFWQRHR